MAADDWDEDAEKRAETEKQWRIEVLDRVDNARKESAKAWTFGLSAQELDVQSVAGEPCERLRAAARAAEGHALDDEERAQAARPVRARSMEGRTLLGAAAGAGAHEIVAAMLRAGVKDGPDDEGLWAIHWAALGGDGRSVELLSGEAERPAIEGEGDGKAWGELTPWLMAAVAGNVCALEALRPKVDPLQISSWRMGGLNALYLAASVDREEDSYRCVRWLIEQGGCASLVNAPVGARKQTPLAWAAWLGHARTLRELLAAGADPKCRCVNGFDALARAAQKGTAECVRILLPVSDPPGPTKKGLWAGMTPLMGAASAKDFESVERLEALLPISDAKARGRDGKTALTLAMSEGGLLGFAKAKLLIEASDVNALDEKGRGALWQAAKAGDELLVRLLLDAGADPLARTLDGETPLGAAAAAGAPARRCVELLAKDRSGPEAAAARSDSGWTPLMAFLSREEKDALGYLMDLVEVAEEAEAEDESEEDEKGSRENKKSDADEREKRLALDLEQEAAALRALIAVSDVNPACGSRGEAPLAMAARNGCPRAVRALLAAGADPRARNNEGLCALAVAVANGQIACADALREADPEPLRASEVFAWLLSSQEAGTKRHLREAKLDWILAQPLARDEDAPERGRGDGARPTPLAAAVNKGWTRAAEAALPWFDPLVIDRDGADALWLAAEHGHEDIFRLLLPFADPWRENASGVSAVDICAKAITERSQRMLALALAGGQTKEKRGQEKILGWTRQALKDKKPSASLFAEKLDLSAMEDGGAAILSEMAAGGRWDAFEAACGSLAPGDAQKVVMAAICNLSPVVAASVERDEFERVVRQATTSLMEAAGDAAESASERAAIEPVESTEPGAARSPSSIATPIRRARGQGRRL
jgi:ankyrin repeat protein